jgi:acyl-CoA reductase-like NAD-dependent aldehyde dehydrogenase
MRPETLTAGQLAGLLKVGDLIVPGDGDLPSFSASGCAQHADRMLAHMNASDRDGLTLLLGMFRFLPGTILRAILRLTDRHAAFPQPIAAGLRMIGLGVKGVVMTLYYSGLDDGSAILHGIKWDAKVVERPSTSDAPDTSLEAAAPSAPGAGGLSPHPTRANGAAPSADATTAAQYVQRARQGSQSLRRLSLPERLHHIALLREVILRRREEIIERIQRDTGKSRSDALISEIFGVLDNLAWLEAHAPKALADRKQPTPLALMGKTSWTWYEPLGTILIISPWNYPFYQAIVPITCAVAAGNTVLYKPSEWTPLEGLVEDVVAEAQFAPNWVQVVYGDGAAGAALVEQRPDKIFFTGSTRTGRRILAQAAPHLIPVELELGGKDAMIVFDDVTIARAAAGAAWGALTTTGQSCTSVERLYVQRSIYGPFRDELVRQVRQLSQATDRHGDADLGAMTTDFQVKIVAEQVADAKAKGAALLTGADWDGVSRMIPPMVVDKVTDDMALASQETFGPIIPLMPFDSEDEVIRRANDSEYGLTASVWTKDLTRAARVSRALTVGGVSVNNVMATEANPALPFGGVKNSGFGRYKGEHGLHAFCNVKSVLIDKDSAKIEANWYPYTTEKYRRFTALTVNLFGERGVKRLIKFALAGLKLERYSNQAAKKDIRRGR